MSPSRKSIAFIKAIPGASFKYHAWGDEHIVYNSVSGNTHLVDELTYYTLQCVKSTLCEAQLFYQLVADAANLELDNDLQHYLQDVLSSLAQNNLIELQSA